MRSNVGRIAYYCEAEHEWKEGSPHIESKTWNKGPKIIWLNVYSCKDCKEYLGYLSGIYITGKDQKK